MLGVPTDKQSVHVVCVYVCVLMMMNSSDADKTRVWEGWEVGQTVCVCGNRLAAPSPQYSTAQHSRQHSPDG